MGDRQGHPFRGNQYTSGVNVSRGDYTERDRMVAKVDLKLKRVGETIDGLTVDHETGVEDVGSVSASLRDYKYLDGIREVPISDFEDNGKPSFYSRTESERVRGLASKIKDSGLISPLIVVYDKEKSPYVLEGGHRFDALKLLGKKSLPALVVVDLEDA